MGSRASLERKPGGPDNWIEAVKGELPGYVREIARSIEKTGKSLSQAIAIAISRIKVWAAGGDGVTAKTQAKAAAALAKWEALKAKADKKVRATHYDVLQRQADLVVLSAMEDLTLRLSVEQAEDEGAVALSRVLDVARAL